MKFVDAVLSQLAALIQRRSFEELESDQLEIKPTPPTGGEWRERYKSANAFLNTRGGVILLGVKEEGRGDERRYVFTGWQAEAENQLKELSQRFTDRRGAKLDLSSHFKFELREFLGGRLAVVYVAELPADEKYVFYDRVAYKRELTGDHAIKQRELEAQAEFQAEAILARELKPVAGMSESDLDLAKLNEFIFQLNQSGLVETMKPDLDSARSFLQRRSFMKDGTVTTLGALVCGRHPWEHLGLRCHVHGYVESTHDIAQDKQDFVDNVLPLMEASLGYILRNIQVGITAEHGGTSRPQYPEPLLRETVNNALAHRDYSIDKQVSISIKPGRYVSIRNPGEFRPHLLIEDLKHPIPLRRIVPETKPRNPKLADVLRVFR